jgi:hypothetical protein
MNLIDAVRFFRFDQQSKHMVRGIVCIARGSSL